MELIFFDEFTNRINNDSQNSSYISSKSKISYYDEQINCRNNLIFKFNQEEKRVYNKRTNQKVQRWTHQECLLYEYFIEKYQKIMKDSGSKRNTKIFQLMSKFIGKTPSQCRSHHQKFYKKIIENLNQQKNQDISNQESSNKNQIMVYVYQIKDMMQQKLNQKDISEKLEKLERLTNNQKMLQKATFLQKMEDPLKMQPNSILEDIEFCFNYNFVLQNQKMIDINLTPCLQPEKSPKIQDFKLEFNLEQNEEDFQNVSWKNVMFKIEKIDQSINQLINLMQNTNY